MVHFSLPIFIFNNVSLFPLFPCLSFTMLFSLSILTNLQIWSMNSQYLLKAFCVGCEEKGIIRFAMAAWNPILRRRQRMTRIENRDVYVNVIRWTPWDRVYRNPGMKIVIYVWFYNCWKGIPSGRIYDSIISKRRFLSVIHLLLDIDVCCS